MTSKHRHPVMEMNEGDAKLVMERARDRELLAFSMRHISILAGIERRFLESGKVDGDDAKPD